MNKNEKAPFFKNISVMAAHNQHPSKKNLPVLKGFSR
jgi:hypothetical protein